MGDTQKSPTISTKSQGIASQAADDPTGCSAEQGWDKPPLLGKAEGHILTVCCWNRHF